MKKLLFIIMLIVLSGLIYAQDIQEKFLGKWTAKPFLIEQDDGLLVEPGATYSFPHLGITDVDFLDSEFIVFTVSGSKYRAFYEVEELDFDNSNINCIFKNGEQFLFKLVRSDGESWKYLYRITKESVLRGDSANLEDPEPEQGAEPLTLMADDGASESNEVVETRLYTGIIKRK